MLTTYEVVLNHSDVKKTSEQTVKSFRDICKSSEWEHKNLLFTVYLIHYLTTS